MRLVAVIAFAGLASAFYSVTSAFAGDVTSCMRASASIGIAACTRELSAGGQTVQDQALLLLYRGMHFIEVKQFDQAMSDFDRAIQIDPTSPHPYVGRGQIFLAKQDYIHAIENFSTALRLNPDETTAYSLRGDAYAKKEQYDLAIADYDKAIAINPRSDLAYAGRGATYFEMGEYDRALVDLTIAIKLDPNDPNPYALRGRTHAKNGDFVRAIGDLTTAINMRHPRLDFVYLVRADAYESRGDLKEALADYRKAAGSAEARLSKEANVGIRRVEAKLAGAEVSSSEKLQSTGSGFVVSARGYILTNYHVVEGCAKLKVSSAANNFKKATIFATDEANDLAVLQSNFELQSILSFRQGRGIKQADQIILVGFPLSGSHLLSTSANVSTGTVTALAGPNDDSRWLQISAPTQPGNSGGPVLDLSGNVVGVAVATLNAAEMLKSAGILPQNINFAIKSNVATNLLDAKGIAYEVASSETKLEPGDVAAKGVRSTVLVQCYK